MTQIAQRGGDLRRKVGRGCAVGLFADLPGDGHNCAAHWHRGMGNVAVSWSRGMDGGGVASSDLDAGHDTYLLWVRGLEIWNIKLEESQLEVSESLT